MPAQLVQRNKQRFKKVKVDTVTIDIIENALRNARFEMDAVLFRTAMSPGIREQHDEFPMIADREGKMVVGQFGSFIGGFLEGYDGTIEEGDIFLTNDPYSVRRRDQPRQRLAGVAADLSQRSARRLGGDVRPHDGRRRQGARIAADRCAHDLRGRNTGAAGKDLQARHTQPGRARIMLHNCPHAALEQGATSTPSSRPAAPPPRADRDVRALRRRCLPVRRCADCWREIGARCASSSVERYPRRSSTSRITSATTAWDMGPYKIACSMWREGDKVHSRLCRHRPAVDLIDQLLPQRRTCSRCSSAST